MMKNNQVLIKSTYQNREHNAQSKKKDVLVTLHRKRRMSFNLFDENYTQEYIQLYRQHEES